MTNIFIGRRGPRTKGAGRPGQRVSSDARWPGEPPASAALAPGRSRAHRAGTELPVQNCLPRGIQLYN
ncbi:hypothetical protein XU18_0884 [Perkinsela sp. CCAP 1560/4]|nr:hypothetical protein XU18_0884 [Perkinsela sp. CCAP 1560/4]|eukprot:KNH08628.1 hypothetical protein XU18_0884 [Perkinsela sp. CCAP 1560/4]